MKTIKLFCALTTVILAVSCNDNDNIQNNAINGSWRLTEVLSDPGDGSGTFSPVVSSKTINFSNDGTLTCNGDICNMTSEASVVTTGTYTSAQNTINADCFGDYTYTYTISGNTLIINYPCIEPCKAKFVRIL